MRSGCSVDLPFDRKLRSGWPLPSSRAALNCCSSDESDSACAAATCCRQASSLPTTGAALESPPPTSVLPFKSPVLRDSPARGILARGCSGPDHAAPSDLSASSQLSTGGCLEVMKVASAAGLSHCRLRASGVHWR